MIFWIVGISLVSCIFVAFVMTVVWGDDPDKTDDSLD